jgi:acetoacetyl-CoA synthetase
MNPMWTPSPERAERSNMARFITFVRVRGAAEVRDYQSLYDWSVQHPEAFWPAVWEFCDVRADVPWERVLVDGDKMPGARWFVGSRLNFAQNLLRVRDERPALVFEGEDGRSAVWSYRVLYGQVARLARALREAGVTPGDRVAGLMPNLPETIAAMLAAASLGAIWSSCSPDFGDRAVLDRFGQIQPKVLFLADGYHYKGRAVDTLARAPAILGGLDTLQRVVVVPYLHEHPALPDRPGVVHYGEFLGANDEPALDFVQLPFDHPVYIMYSSGTTGKPKCIVHAAGGTLLQHLKELVLHTDLCPEDRMFYFTTCGWMMWNWMVSSLAVGATVVLYDGQPLHPQPARLFEFAQRHAVTVFGTSAKYLMSVEKAGVRARDSHPLPALRAILSTGSPLPPESFDYVYRDLKPDLQLCSISGGTDIISCFALGNPLLPVWRGELQCRGLGMRVEIYDEQGNSVTGKRGELVCTAPFPSMPVAFWGDPDGRRYRAAYFERFAGVWTHGDYAELSEHDGLIIYGRSDAVLNPGGVRIGTAEIYSEVEKLTEVLEAIAVGQEWDHDERVILFVKLREGVVFDAALAERIKSVIRDNTSPRHVPAKVVHVPDIPRTINNKISELAVRAVIHDRPVKNADALANPEALEYYRDLEELKA